MTLRRDSIIVCALVVCGALGMAAAPAGAQRLPPTIRLEAGSLNHGDVFRATMALGVSVGWPRSPQGTFLLRYIRQSQDDAGTDVGRHARSWLMASWEHAFGAPALYKRQALVRFGAGLLFRPALHVAPVAGAGLGLRYELARHWSLLANIEDDAALLTSQNATVCDPFRGCVTYHFDTEFEHNLGLMISGEWTR